MRWLWFICLSHCFSLGKVSVIIELFSKRQYARIAFFGGFTNTFFYSKTIHIFKSCKYMQIYSCKYIYISLIKVIKVVNIYILYIYIYIYIYITTFKYMSCF